MLHEEFDVIFLDIHLNALSGKDVYRKAKERSDRLARRIIFITGDLRNPQTESFVQQTGNLCLEKPFTLTELKHLLEQFFKESENADPPWRQPVSLPFKL